MGIRKPSTPVKSEPLTEQLIQRRLNGFFASWKYNVDGLFVFGWESDKLIWTKAGYIYEFEVKISRADYMNDFRHKVEKHLLLNSALPDEKTEARQADLFDHLLKQKQKRAPQITMDVAKQMLKPVGDKMPNYFYYAVPDGMIEPDEVPPYAGLIYVFEESTYHGKFLRIVREAPRLHSTKYTDGEMNLGEKFYYNMKSWQRRHKEQTEYSLMYRQRLQHELDSKHQEKSYSELEDELKTAQQYVEAFKKQAQNYYGMYMTMVEGADYNTIERHVFFDVLRSLGIDVKEKYKEIMAETERRYNERYPSRRNADATAVDGATSVGIIE
ncbi:MAG: hypothetical protein IK144_11815 [Bacteroidaceae bacterium]|nr:hypothetical protein [Bacteroidaceae bacterium]